MPTSRQFFNCLYLLPELTNNAGNISSNIGMPKLLARLVSVSTERCRGMMKQDKEVVVGDGCGRYDFGKDLAHSLLPKLSDFSCIVDEHMIFYGFLYKFFENIWSWLGTDIVTVCGHGFQNS